MSNKTPYYQILGTRELLQNKALASVLPQIPKSYILQNVYSYAKVEYMVAQYLTGLLQNARYDVADGIIVKKGKHDRVMAQVKQAVPLIEAFFNNVPSVVKNIRRNTKMYLPYATLGEVKEIKTVAGKLKALRLVLENITYNPDLNSENRIAELNKRRTFATAQKAWKNKVGYKE